jgi:two-component system chemotaxis response regulator CheY
MPRAMVVDDSRAVRLILSRTLAEMGFEAIQAGNGREAFEALQKYDPVVFALVDWNMPEVNGLEFVRRVRACPAFSGVRLIMVTTETESEQITLALEAGADEYVMKPFTRETVEDKLRLIGII